MIWIVIADSNCSRIYSYHRSPAALSLIKEIQHPEIRVKKSEFLTSDKPGRYQAKDSGHGAYTQTTDPKDVAIIKFSQEIAAFLEHARKEHAYNKLILIAPPHMHGVISQALNEHIRRLITHNINKDYLHISEKELLAYLQEEVLI